MKILSIPLEEYEKDKQTEFNRGFNNAVYHVSKCLKLKPSERFEYLLNYIGDEDAYRIAKKFDIEIPEAATDTPNFSESEDVPF